MRRPVRLPAASARPRPLRTPGARASTGCLQLITEARVVRVGGENPLEVFPCHRLPPLSEVVASALEQRVVANRRIPGARPQRLLERLLCRVKVLLPAELTSWCLRGRELT